MNESFADWHRVASINPRDYPLESLWKGVESVVGELDPARVLDTVRVAVGLAPTDAAFLDGFRGKFREHDESFPSVDNDLHLQVLAGACVMQLLDQGEQVLAGVAALASCCAAFGHDDETPSGPPVLQRARQFLDESAITARESEKRGAKIPEFAKLPKRLEELSSAIQQHAAPLNEPLKSWLGELLTATKAAVVVERTARSTFEARLGVLAEETNVLWWLYSGWSRDLGCPLSSLAVAPAAVLAGKELADLTEFQVGPRGVRAFLRKGLSVPVREATASDENVTLREAVDQLPRDWRDELANDDAQSASNITPVRSAVCESMRVNDGDDWSPAFRHRTLLEAGITCAALRLAEQTYHECLLAQSLSE